MKNRSVSKNVVGLEHVQRTALDVRTVSDRVRKLERKSLYQESIVADLPSNPVDGQTVIVQTATMLANGISWQFRYNAGGGTYPWKFVGGTVWLESIATQQTSTATTYADLATVGPQITVPLKGQYVCNFGSTQDYSVILANRIAFSSLSNAGATPTDAAAVRSGHPNIANLVQSVSRQEIITIAAAGDLLKLQYRGSGDTVRFANRHLSLLPIHVSL